MVPTQFPAQAQVSGALHEPCPAQAFAFEAFKPKHTGIAQAEPTQFGLQVHESCAVQLPLLLQTEGFEDEILKQDSGPVGAQVAPLKPIVHATMSACLLEMSN